MRDPRSLFFCVTSSVSVGFFDGQLAYLREQGWKCTLAASPDVPDQLEDFARAEGAAAVALELSREINLRADVVALASAARVLRRERPATTNVGTPKAGLVWGLAAFLTRVPLRIYTLHGLRFETATGVKRRLLSLAERFSMSLAHEVVCVSPSLKERVVDLGLARQDKLFVLGHGSVNGVQVSKAPHENLGGTTTVGFVGRIARDKGVDDLVRAYDEVQRKRPNGVRLLLVGDEDPLDPINGHSAERIASDASIEATGHVADVAAQYRRMDVLVLPSYREGLPSVVLEAAAVGLPVVVTDVTGARDAVVPGRTGWLVRAGDVDELAAAIGHCVADLDNARSMGLQGRLWVAQHFAREHVWARTDQYLSRAQRRRQRDRRHSALRALDIMGASAGLTVFALPMAALGLVIRRKLGKPVLFRQTRPGIDGEPFTLVKFRSMTDAVDESGAPLPDGQRLTSFGRWLRQSSLDELPSLWNVLKGELSLVGPRPLLVRYTPYFTEFERIRLAARPGITGLAQVRGRNNRPWDARLADDVTYVINRGVRNYLSILGMTVRRVVSGSDVVADAESVMQNLDDERRDDGAPSSKTG